MLIEKIQGQITRMNEFKKLKEIAGEAELYKTRLSMLESPLEKLRQLKNVRILLVSRGAKQIVDKAQLAALRSRIKFISAEFIRDNTTITKPNQELGHGFWNPLRQLPAKIEAALLSSWKAYVQSKRPGVSEEILTVLGNVTPFRDQVRVIRGLMSQMEDISANLPQSEEDFERISNLSDALDRAWGNLKGDGIPKDVLEFIKKAAVSEAIYDDFSDRIRDWLESRGLVKNLRMVLR